MDHTAQWERKEAALEGQLAEVNLSLSCFVPCVVHKWWSFHNLLFLWKESYFCYLNSMSNEDWCSNNMLTHFTLPTMQLNWTNFLFSWFFRLEWAASREYGGCGRKWVTSLRGPRRCVRNILRCSDLVRCDTRTTLSFNYHLQPLLNFSLFI